MYYWNQDNLLGLSQLADLLRDDSKLSLIGTYCDLRERGLRKQALTTTSRFIALSRDLPIAEQRDVADRLMTVSMRHPEVYQFLPHPIVADFLVPVFQTWRYDDPGSGAAARWLGLLTHDHLLLRAALDIDATDQIARGHLIASLLRGIDFATHELAEGGLIGDYASVVSELVETRQLLDDAEDSASIKKLRAWHQGQAGLLEAWIRYQQDPRGTFQQWREAQGLDCV